MANDNDLIRDLRAAAYSGQTLNAELVIGRRHIPVPLAVKAFALTSRPAQADVLEHDFTCAVGFHLTEQVGVEP